MTATIAQLRSRFDTLFDVSNTSVLLANEKDQLLSDGYRALWAEVVAVCKTFRITTLTFTLSGTTQTKALPPDFREVVYVRSDPGLDTQRYLNKYGPRTANLSDERSYRMASTNLVIEPPQRAAGNYALDYIPQCLPLGPVGFTVKLAIFSLPAYTTNGIFGPGHTLTATANGALNINGITFLANDRVLIDQQTNTTDNGIYVVVQTGDGTHPWVLTRSTDYNLNSQVNYGDLIQDQTFNFVFMNTTPQFTIGLDFTPTTFAFIELILDPELEQFQDFVLYSAVIQALAREESDISVFQAMLDAERARVLKWARDQRTADPELVEDVRHRSLFGFRGPF